MAVNYYKTYTDAANAAQQQQRLAELLQQQADQSIPQYSYQGIQAMPSYAAGLAKILSAYGARKASDKAMEASRQAGERVEQAGTGIAGRLMGGFTPDASLVKKTDMGYEATPRQVPEQTSLEEVTPTSQYKQSPQDALRMAMTPAGGAAMKGNPLLAQMLMQQAGPKNLEYGTPEVEMINGQPHKVAYAKNGVGKIDYGIATPRDAYSMGMTPEQKAKYELDVKKFGVDIANAELARRKAADEGVNVSGLGLPGMPAASGTGGPVANPAVPAAPARTPRPTTQPASGQPPQAQPVPGQAPQAPTDQANVPLINNPQISPKQKRDLMLAQPQARAAAANMQSSISNINNMADDLLGHSGLDKITGPFGQVKLTDLSPDARSARARYDSMKGQAALLRVAMARAESSTGGAYGNLTENEWPRLENALGAIELAQDGPSLRNALVNFKSVLNGLSDNTKSIYESTYGKLNYTPPKYTPDNERFPRQAQPNASDLRQRADAILSGAGR